MAPPRRPSRRRASSSSFVADALARRARRCSPSRSQVTICWRSSVSERLRSTSLSVVSALASSGGSIALAREDRVADPLAAALVEDGGRIAALDLVRALAGRAPAELDVEVRVGQALGARLEQPRVGRVRRRRGVGRRQLGQLRRLDHASGRPPPEGSTSIGRQRDRGDRAGDRARRSPSRRRRTAAGRGGALGADPLPQPQRRAAGRAPRARPAPRAGGRAPPPARASRRSEPRAAARRRPCEPAVGERDEVALVLLAEPVRVHPLV